MPLEQGTFTIVPNALGLSRLGQRAADAPQSRPPMTSKQAQKLHKKATRTPRMSKAEQRRLERIEQEEIKKEIETKRARAARERKKEKDQLKKQEEKEERRRHGQPLVDVRPSQNLISIFVRGNGTGKKRNWAELPPLAVVEEDQENEDPNQASSTGSSRSQPKSKKQRIQEPASPSFLEPKQDEDDASDGREMGDMDKDERTTRHSSLDSAEASLMADAQLYAEAVEVEIGRIDLRNQSTHRAMSMATSPEAPEAPEDNEADHSQRVRNTRSTSAKTANQELQGPICSEAIRPTARPFRSTPVNAKGGQEIQGTRHPVSSLERGTATQQITPVRSDPPKPTRLPMGPPCIPPRRNAQAPTTNIVQPCLPPKQLQTPVPKARGNSIARVVNNQIDDLPPSSTQAFLFSHLDDLFPSPSQLAEELLQDDQPTPIAQPAPATEPFPFFSTQDFVLSSQDMRELQDTPPVPSKTKPRQYSTNNLRGNRSGTSPSLKQTPEEIPAPPAKAVDAHVESPKPLNAPPKKRFFTSSNREAMNRVAEHRAVQQSRWTHRREEQARALQRHEEEERERRSVAQHAAEARQAERGARGTECRRSQRLVLQRSSSHKGEPKKRCSEDLQGDRTSDAPSSGQPPDVAPRVSFKASQETDYGDIDLEEVEELSRLLDEKSADEYGADLFPDGGSGRLAASEWRQMVEAVNWEMEMLGESDFDFDEVY